MLCTKTIATAITFAACSVLANVGTASAQNGAYLNVCVPGSDTWTLYESSQPGMFQQEFGLTGPGEYRVTVTANGFGFEGFAYTRGSAWDDWRFISQTSKGEYRWSQSWHVIYDDPELFMLQLIKSDNQCRGCTITVNVVTSGCQSNTGGGTSSGNMCAPNQCYTGENALYGVGTCVARPGWDGSNCP